MSSHRKKKLKKSKSLVITEPESTFVPDYPFASTMYSSINTYTQNVASSSSKKKEQEEKAKKAKRKQYYSNIKQQSNQIRKKINRNLSLSNPQNVENNNNKQSLQSSNNSRTDHQPATNNHCESTSFSTAMVNVNNPSSILAGHGQNNSHQKEFRINEPYNLENNNNLTQKDPLISNKVLPSVQPANSQEALHIYNDKNPRRNESNITAGNISCLPNRSSYTINPGNSFVNIPGGPPRYQDRVKLNVSGWRYEIADFYLKKFPTSLLGNEQARQKYFVPETGEYTFDRHPLVFAEILYFYISLGECFECPPTISHETYEVWMVN